MSTKAISSVTTGKVCESWYTTGENVNGVKSKKYTTLATPSEEDLLIIER